MSWLEEYVKEFPNANPENIIWEWMVKHSLPDGDEKILSDALGKVWEKYKMYVKTTETSERKYVIVLDDIKHIYGKLEGKVDVTFLIGHFSVIHTSIDKDAIYFGTFDSEEEAIKHCTELNKEWERYYGEKYNK